MVKRPGVPGGARRGLALLMAILLAGCVAAQPVADRGIGGTGAPAQIETADRGIGGTGVTGGTTITGGTGIFGAITGFGSIWVDGVEVQTDAATRVTGEAGSASAAALGVGQVVAVQADEANGALRARQITLRTEVSGPVQSVGNGAAVVAGQRVTIASGTPGGAALRPGSWVDVSGFRTQDGAVAATRFDQRAATGPVSASGPVSARDGGLFVGDLRLSGTAPLPAAGSFVQVEGTYRGGALEVTRVAPDLIATDPGAYFGPRTGRLLIEGYARGGSGRMAIGPGLRLSAASGLAAAGGGRSVVTLDRQPNGALVATGLNRPVARGAPRPGLFRPAPFSQAARPGMGERPDPFSRPGFAHPFGRGEAPAPCFGCGGGGLGGGIGGGGFRGGMGGGGSRGGMGNGGPR